MATSASARMRCLYSAVKALRLASAATSRSGRGGLGSSGTTGDAEEIPVLTPLSNYDRENCLIHVGMEGWNSLIYLVKC
jgi:hypothetical protein